MFLTHTGIGFKKNWKQASYYDIDMTYISFMSKVYRPVVIEEKANVDDKDHK